MIATAALAGVRTPAKSTLQITFLVRKVFEDALGIQGHDDRGADLRLDFGR